MTIDVYQTFYFFLLFIYFIILLTHVIFCGQIINCARITFKEFNVKNVTAIIMLMCFTILISPTLLILLLIFYLYSHCIDVILRLKHGSKYGGLVGGGEIFFCVATESSTSVMNLLMIVDFEGTPDEFYNRVKDHVNKTLFSKLNTINSSILQKYGGYFYTLNNEYSVYECVTVLDDKSDCDKIDENVLQKVMNEFGSKPLPKNNNSLLEIVVGRKPCQWKNNRKKQYPLILRCHHRLGDGPTLAKWFITYIVDSTNSHSEHHKTKIRFYINTKKLWRYFNYALFYLVSPIIFLLQSLIIVDKNRLHPGPLSGQKILAWKTESDKKYIKLIKQLKQKLPGIGFADIILASISKTLHEYMQEFPDEIPRTTYIGLAAATELPNLREFVASPDKNFEITCKRFAAAVTLFPLSSDKITKNVYEIKKYMNMLKNSLVVQVVNLYMRTARYFPSYVTEELSRRKDATLIFSNLPGDFDHLTVCGGIPIDDYAGWTVQRFNIGMTIYTTTYDGNLKVGLTVDRTLIPHEETARKLLDKMFEQFDILKREVEGH